MPSPTLVLIVSGLPGVPQTPFRTGSRALPIVPEVNPDQILDQLVALSTARLAEFELVDPVQPWLFDELAGAWRAAQADAAHAYDHWRSAPGADAYAVYRAAQDRADCAQDALAARAAR